MNLLEKKRFIMSLIFTIMTGVGAVMIIIGLWMRRSYNELRLLYLIIIMPLPQFYQYFQGIFIFLLLEFSRITRIFNFFTIIMYVGIATCGTGGTVALISWDMYKQSTRGKI